MDDQEFINDRGVRLQSKESVLFLFNLASGNNFNTPDIEVGPVTALDSGGRTRVNMKGLQYRGLSGNPSAKGTARFTYIRPNLANMNIPSDGSFFDLMAGAPNFIAAVNEFKRRTQFNCTTDDFDEAAFYPDANGHRWLKAKATSHRFIGQINIGRPRRDMINVVANQTITVNLSNYNGIFFRNADRLRMSLDISHRHDVYSTISVGQVFTNPNDPCVLFVLSHLERKNIEAGFSEEPINGVNLHGMRVIYRGAVRTSDGVAPNNRDRVIAVQLKPIPGQWSGGELRFFYPSVRINPPRFNPADILAVSLTRPRVWTDEEAAALSALSIGQHLTDLMPIRLVDTIFQAVLFTQYNPTLHGGFRVVYNGPNRPKDQLPTDVLSCQVIEFEANGARLGAVSGPLKLLYRMT